MCHSLNPKNVLHIIIIIKRIDCRQYFIIEGINTVNYFFEIKTIIIKPSLLTSKIKYS